MEIRSLRYAVTLAEELHFGRAAQRHFIAPQPFGRHIRQLEREVGKRLFERTSRRVALTPAGERLVAEARRVLAAVDGLAEVARADAPHDGAHPDLRYVPVEGPTCAAAIATRESDDRPGVAAFRRAARPLGGS